eukprot:TRINITY_DN1312_c0_g1_i12.p1 TRINITY_DN1312_c0_g1~~TRINITY_DN1312_c0_g1_i12.p1  ORF type:complete len:124 (+),score=33.46 TRINITY_DN1312_c0_g1_i12:624-995(+)
MSAMIGKHLVVKAFPKLIKELNKRIEDNKENLIYYMLFLRISPLLPNWFINVSAPIVGIPYSYFLFATLFGLMPANILHVKTGLMLKEINSIGFNIKNFLLLFCLAFAALIPTLFKKQISNYK